MLRALTTVSSVDRVDQAFARIDAFDLCSNHALSCDMGGLLKSAAVAACSTGGTATWERGNRDIITQPSSKFAESCVNT